MNILLYLHISDIVLNFRTTFVNHKGEVVTNSKVYNFGFLEKALITFHGYFFAGYYNKLHKNMVFP